MNILRLELPAQLVDLGVNSGQDFRCVFVFEEIDDPLDRVRILVLTQDPFGLLVAVAQAAEVPDQDWHAVALGHHDIAEVIKGAHEPDATDDETLIAAGNPSASRHWRCCCLSR